MGRFIQGKYIPKNKQKYMGDVNDVVYRSSWERRFMVHCDVNDKILSWGSEIVVIPYISPKDGRPHRYFMDFIYTMKDREGNIKTILVEVKPNKEKFKPTKGKKTPQRYMQECVTYEVNQAKWKAAEAYCKQRGWIFTVMTELELFPTLKRQKPLKRMKKTKKTQV